MGELKKTAYKNAKASFFILINFILYLSYLGITRLLLY